MKRKPPLRRELLLALLRCLRETAYGAPYVQSIPILARYLGWPGRKVQQGVHDLNDGALNDLGCFVVGYSCGSPPGVYLCATEAEALEALARRESRRDEESRTIASIRRTLQRWGMPAPNLFAAADERT